MKNKKKLLIIVGSTILLMGFVVFACSSLFSSNERDNQDPAKQKEMMAIILEWGRLVPFPTSASDVSVKTEGGTFTRAFRASFIAPKQDSESWIKDSPGLNEATPKELPENKVQYTIEPGGGASHAEVTIDYISGKVEIYVYWS